MKFIKSWFSNSSSLTKEMSQWFYMKKKKQQIFYFFFARTGELSVALRFCMSVCVFIGTIYIFLIVMVVVVIAGIQRTNLQCFFACLKIWFGVRYENSNKRGLNNIFQKVKNSYNNLLYCCDRKHSIS